MHGNAARDSLYGYAAKDITREGDTNTQMLGVDLVTKQTITFWSLGAVMQSYLVEPYVSDKGNVSYRGLTVMLHRWERERMGAFFSMLFRNLNLNVQVDAEDGYVFQTRFKSKKRGGKLLYYSIVIFLMLTRTSELDFSSGPSPAKGLRVGKLTIPTYSSPVKASTGGVFTNGLSFGARSTCP